MFLSVVILRRFTTETHAMALQHSDRHAAATYTTSGDAPVGVAKSGSALLKRSGADARIVSMVNADGFE